MNYADLGRGFAGSTPRSRWKTFVLEAHNDGDSAGLLAEAFGRANVGEPGRCPPPLSRRWRPRRSGGSRCPTAARGSVGLPSSCGSAAGCPTWQCCSMAFFSSSEPFRLWGIPQMTGEGTAEVEAVDLHVGQQLRFDVTSTWMRVYLFDRGRS